jgi:Tfp pilus assembly protein PilN
MPKSVKYKINLLPQDPFFKTSLGRTMSWSINVGRYIVIFTQIVVIISFASRFVLDRRITDLNKSIHQKQLMIESQSQFESEFRLAQAKIKSYQEIDQQSNLVEVFPLLQKVVPYEFRLNTLRIQPGVVNGEGLALSNNALNLFISNLQLSPNFHDIVVNRIETTDERATGFAVNFNVKFKL